jgi:hypothetical protein
MFIKLTSNLINLPINNEDRLKGAIDIIFEKSIDEQVFSQTYAQLCKVLSNIKVPSNAEPLKHVNFRTMLLTRCQKEFDTDYQQEINYDKLILEVDQCVDEQKKRELKELAEEKVITELPDVAIKGRQWLRKLPEDSFVLVHKNFTRLKDAQVYMRNKDWLVNARIVPVFTQGRDEARFAVMTGFFRSKERAKTTIERLGLSADVAVMAVPVAVSQAVPKNTKP